MPRYLTESEVEAFRERICVVAEKLFADHGLATVTMRQIAAELGVTAMSLYRYFQDKEDILAAVRTRGFDRISEVLEAALSRWKGSSGKGASVSQAYIDFALNNAPAYRLMFDLTQPNEQQYPDLVRANARARATLEAFVERLIAAGRVRTASPELTAHAYWAAIHGLVVLHLAGKLAHGIDFDKLHACMIDALARGFRSQ